MTEEKEYLSKGKFKELGDELDFLKTTRRKEIAEKLEFAKSLGDLSENAEYQEARQEQAATEDRIMTIEGILSSAEIISKNRSTVVGVGSKVIIKREGTRGTQEYQIVGSEEADMAEGKVSNKSPIGEALLGGSKGDTVTYSTPKGEMKIKIMKVK